MSYQRVIPRDLFNEANLLKCYGQLALLIHDYKFPTNPRLELEPTLNVNDWGDETQDSSFRIEQDDDGGLCIVNLNLYVNDRLCSLRRPLNARQSFPLYLSLFEWDEPILVFNDDGTFSAEMKKFLDKAV